MLGSGLVGRKLVRLWVACGSVAETVTGADAIPRAGHWSRTKGVLVRAGDMAGQGVLNCHVPLDEVSTESVRGTTPSGAEAPVTPPPRARWAAVLDTSPPKSFAPVLARDGTAPAPRRRVCGDEARARLVAVALVRGIGFAPLDSGGVGTARFVEPFAMVAAEPRARQGDDR